MVTNYRVGDIVTVINTGSSWYRQQGKITRIHVDDDKVTVKIGRQRGRVFASSSVRLATADASEANAAPDTARSPTPNPTPPTTATDDAIRDLRDEMQELKVMMGLIATFIGLRIDDQVSPQMRRR
jgi:hypothetical protein